MSLFEESIYNELNENIAGDVENATSDNEIDAKDPAEGSGDVIERKKRVVRTKQFRLNIELLKGPRGIHTIENYFKDIKYKGKHHEKEDLDEIMKKLGYWAHRLYPKYSFDDTITTIENLGKKRALQTHLIKYRQNMLEDEVQLDANQIEGEDNIMVNEEPIDEMDALLDQQIALSKLSNTTTNLDTSNNLFDSVRDDHSHRNVSTGISGIAPFETPPESASNIAPKPTALTDEQKARIAENRRIAIERLKARQNRQNQA